MDAVESNLARRLSDGRFHLVFTAQRITRNLRTTIEFLQQSEAKVAFHAVELVKFADDDQTTTAYEGRAATSPTRRRGRTATGGTVDIETVLSGHEDPAHQERLENLVEYCRSLQLTFEPGSRGFSIRTSVPDRAEPVTVAWVFPPDAGYLGMRGLNLGYDTGIVRKLSVAPRFQAYVDRLRELEGASPISARAIDGVSVEPAALGRHQDVIIDAIGALITGIDATG